MARILIAEDDKAILAGLEANLRYEGHDTTSYGRGDDAFRAFSASPADLVILDVMLPGLNGLEVCRQIRSENARVPILIVTARSEDADKVRGLDLGADDYLTKPFSVAELLARVRSLLRRALPPLDMKKCSAAMVGSTSIDFAGYTALRSGQPVHLTAKEFALLRLFVSNPNVAIARDAILSDLWGGDSAVTNRTVDTHVLALRQKLELDPANPQFIVTVHGVGYKYVAS